MNKSPSSDPSPSKTSPPASASTCATTKHSAPSTTTTTRACPSTCGRTPTAASSATPTATPSTSSATSSTKTSNKPASHPNAEGQFSIVNSQFSISNFPHKPFDASRYEKYFSRPYLSPEARRFLFDQRRLDPRVIRWCRLTSWRDRQGTNWLQIPYYDKEGKLVGIQNRNLTPGGEPRFRFPKGAQCGIYNLPVLNKLEEGEPLYIAEGCSDCWALLSAGHKAIAIPSATLLSQKDKDQLSILNSQFSINFHMYPDRDLPGERLFLQLQALLPNLTHHHLPPPCKDYSDLYRCAKREQSKLACYAGSCGS